MKKAINIKFLNNLVILLLSSTITYSQNDEIPIGCFSYNYISASSNMGAAYGYNFVPKNIDDNSLNTWWSPLREDREACWIKISFDNDRLIDNIKIHGGAHNPNFNLGNLFFLNLRLKSAHLIFSDGTSTVINLEDIDKIQTIYFPRQKASYVILRPISYYSSYKWNDLCISYIKFGN